MFVYRTRTGLEPVSSRLVLSCRTSGYKSVYGIRGSIDSRQNENHDY